ncbi:hypothetical protein QOT17_015173 [Balamuthia mandrillaris]
METTTASPIPTNKHRLMAERQEIYMSPTDVNVVSPCSKKLAHLQRKRANSKGKRLPFAEAENTQPLSS